MDYEQKTLHKWSACSYEDLYKYYGTEMKYAYEFCLETLCTGKFNCFDNKIKAMLTAKTKVS